jgi:hypothetical protein
MAIHRPGQLTGRDRSDSDLLSFRIASRIPLRSEDDRDGKTWFYIDVYSVESMLGASLMAVSDEVHVKVLRTYQCDLSEVGVFAQKKHQGFCFRVSEPHVVLEDFGTIVSYHETSEQDADEWEAYLTLGGGIKRAVGYALAFLPHTIYCRL